MKLPSQEKKRLLKRIERLKGTAAVHRLRGEIVKATRYEHMVDSLVRTAERHHLAGAAMHAEERGMQHAHAVISKLKR